MDIQEEKVLNCWQKRRQYTAQERAMVTGTLLMINSGMIFAWLIYNMDFREQPWTYTAWESEILVIKGSWFIGSIVGGFNCGYFIDSIGRRRVIRITIAAYMISALILIFFPTVPVGLMIGMVFAGYAFGGSYLTMIAYSGEISTQRNRGHIVSLLHLGILIGIFVFTLLNAFTLYNEDIDMVSLMGIISGVICIALLPIHYFLMPESPFYLVKHEMDSESIDVFMHLRNERPITTATRNEFHEIQQTVERDFRLTDSVFKLSEFYYILVLRGLLVFAFNYPLNHAHMKIAHEAFGPVDGYRIYPIILAAIRVLFGLFVHCLVDKFGRKLLNRWCAGLGSGLYLISAILVTSKTEPIVEFVFLTLGMITVPIVISVADILSAEAFTANKKGTSLSLVNCFECLLQLLLMMLGTGIGITYVFSFVIIFLCATGLGLIALLHVPETKNTSLFMARNKFNGLFIDVKCCR